MDKLSSILRSLREIRDKEWIPKSNYGEQLLTRIAGSIGSGGEHVGISSLYLGTIHKGTYDIDDSIHQVETCLNQLKLVLLDFEDIISQFSTLSQEAHDILNTINLEDWSDDIEPSLDLIVRFISHSIEEYGLKKKIVDSITLNSHSLAIQSLIIAWKTHPYIYINDYNQLKTHDTILN